MDMSINQRLANFLYEKKISQEELRIKLGLKTRQQVSNWLNCRDHIPDKHLMGIIRLFPELNANWLIREIGSPLIDQKSLRQINRNEFGFCEECLEKDKEIETLKTLLLKKEEEIEKKEKEMRESCRELGKMEERLSQFEKVLAQKECTIIIWNLKKIISIFVASKENRRDDKTKSHDSELVVAPVELRNKR